MLKREKGAANVESFVVLHLGVIRYICGVRIYLKSFKMNQLEYENLSSQEMTKKGMYTLIANIIEFTYSISFISSFSHRAVKCQDRSP